MRHVNTKGYLHSHNHNSPISGQQEVSCFDKEDHGMLQSSRCDARCLHFTYFLTMPIFDDLTGDDWQVVCTGKAKEWMREDGIKLVHVETKKYLSANSKYSFAAPIPGQLEVACSTKDGSFALWAAQASILNEAKKVGLPKIGSNLLFNWKTGRSLFCLIRELEKSYKQYMFFLPFQ